MNDSMPSVDSPKLVVSGCKSGSSSQHLYDAVYFQAQIRLPVLTLGRTDTTALIIETNFWDMLVDGERHMAGKYLLHMTTNARLPILHIPRPGARNPYPLVFKVTSQDKTLDGAHSIAGRRQLSWPVDDNYPGRLRADAGRVPEAGLS